MRAVREIDRAVDQEREANSSANIPNRFRLWAAISPGSTPHHNAAQPEEYAQYAANAGLLQLGKELYEAIHSARSPLLPMRWRRAPTAPPMSPWHWSLHSSSAPTIAPFRHSMAAGRAWPLSLQEPYSRKPAMMARAATIRNTGMVSKANFIARNVPPQNRYTDVSVSANIRGL